MQISQDIIKANDILDKFDFFNQPAGYEHWVGMPEGIKVQDLEDKAKDIQFLKDLVNRATVLPCKLYDTVYMVGRYTCQIIASTVVGVICLENDYTLLLDNGSYLSFVHQVGETAFFDREQAEQKLREDWGYNYTQEEMVDEE